MSLLRQHSQLQQLLVVPADFSFETLHLTCMPLLHAFAHVHLAGVTWLHVIAAPA
jgi:hypothetical protein